MTDIVIENVENVTLVDDLELENKEELQDATDTVIEALEALSELVTLNNEVAKYSDKNMSLETYQMYSLYKDNIYKRLGYQSNTTSMESSTPMSKDVMISLSLEEDKSIIKKVIDGIKKVIDFIINLFKKAYNAITSLFNTSKKKSETVSKALLEVSKEIDKKEDTGELDEIAENADPIEIISPVDRGPDVIKESDPWDLNKKKLGIKNIKINKNTRQELAYAIRIMKHYYNGFTDIHVPFMPFEYFLSLIYEDLVEFSTIFENHKLEESIPDTLAKAHANEEFIKKSTDGYMDTGIGYLVYGDFTPTSKQRYRVQKVTKQTQESIEVDVQELQVIFKTISKEMITQGNTFLKLEKVYNNALNHLKTSVDKIGKDTTLSREEIHNYTTDISNFINNISRSTQDITNVIHRYLSYYNLGCDVIELDLNNKMKLLRKKK